MRKDNKDAQETPFQVVKKPNTPFYQIQKASTVQWVELCIQNHPLFSILDIGAIIFSFLTNAATLSATHVSKGMLYFRNLNPYDVDDKKLLSKNTLFCQRVFTRSRFKVLMDTSIPPFQLKGAKVNSGSLSPSTDMAYNPRSHKVAYVENFDKGYHIYFRDAETRKISKPFIGHSGNICFVTFSRDNAYVASASVDSTTKIWEQSSGRCQLTLLNSDVNDISCIEFSHDNKKIAVVTTDSVKIFDIHTGLTLHKFIGRPRENISVTFSEDDQLIRVAATDGSIETWHIASKKNMEAIVLSPPPAGHRFTVVDMNTAGTKIVALTSNSVLMIFDSSGKCVTQKKLPEPASMLGISGDMILVGYNSGKTRLCAYTTLMHENDPSSEEAIDTGKTTPRLIGGRARRAHTPRATETLHEETMPTGDTVPSATPKRWRL